MGFMPTGVGITKLSQLEIDVDKDWEAKEITNLKAIAADMVEGDLGYRGSSILSRLAKGFIGHYLRQGATAPYWSSVAGKPLFRFVTLLPGEAVLPTVNSPALSKTDGTNFTYDTLDFDKDTEESAYWVFNLAPDYANEDIFVIIRWKSTVNGGDVKWGLSVLGREEGEVWDAALGTEQTLVTTTEDVAGELVYSTILPFPPNLSPNDTVIVKLARKAGDGVDTMAADACVTECFLVWATETIISTITPITPAEVPHYAVDAWTEYDASAIIPSGATGIVFYLHRGDFTNSKFGIRKKGSTDDRHQTVINMVNIWGMAGVDENRKFETIGLLTIVTALHLYIIGYTMPGVTFFTNGKDKTPTALDVWTDTKLAADCPNAKAVIIEIHNAVGAGGEDQVGLRMKGSTDNRYPITNHHTWAIVGCDDDQVIQAYLHDWGGGGNTKIWVVGYITEAVSMFTNGVDKSPAVTGSWETVDCSAEAPGANMLFFEIATIYPYGYYNAGIRTPGDAQDRHGYARHVWAIVKCDSEQKVEIKIAHTDVKVHLIGYSVP